MRIIGEAQVNVRFTAIINGCTLTLPKLNDNSLIMRGKLILVAVVTVAFLTVGICVGRGLGGSDPTVVPPTSTVIPTSTPPSGQIVILLIGVDSRTHPKPTLEFCWVITFQAGNSQYFLLGFPLDMPVPGGNRLLDYYSRGRSLDESTPFIKEAMLTLSEGNLNPQYVIVADRQLVSSLVDDLGGIAINGQTVSSQALFAFYDTIPGTDYEKRVEVQRVAFQALTEAFKRQPWSEASLTDFMQRFQEYSADASALTQLAVNGLPYTEAQFYISPTPTATPAP